VVGWLSGCSGCRGPLPRVVACGTRGLGAETTSSPPSCPVSALCRPPSRQTRQPNHGGRDLKQRTRGQHKAPLIPAPTSLFSSLLYNPPVQTRLRAFPQPRVSTRYSPSDPPCLSLPSRCCFVGNPCLSHRHCHCAASQPPPWTPLKRPNSRRTRLRRSDCSFPRNLAASR